MNRSRFPCCATTLRPWLFAAACGALFPVFEAKAVLGAGADTVQTDQARFKAVRKQSANGTMTTHEISLPDGSSIKEYVNASGIVFAVSWRTRLKPDLEALLGAQYAAHAAAQGAPSGVAASKRMRSIRTADLVVHQAGRMNAFGGLAYVPTLVPVGIDAETLR